MSKKEKLKSSKNAATRPEKVSKQKKFDFAEHNKKVSKARGSKWRKNLTKGKFEAFNNPSAIRTQRSKLGLSQKDIIQGTPIKSLTAFGRIEKGRQSIDTKTGALIAKKLKVSITTLFKTDADKNLMARFGANK